MRIAPALAALTAAVLLLPGIAAPRNAAAASTLDRPEDPVVLTGAQLPTLQGAAPAAIVAFRYLGGWQQVPVQVDERFTQSFSTVYNGAASSTNVNLPVYADADTWTGADPNAAFDADDELVFMAKDAGDQALNGPPPSHTTPGSGIELQLTDPLQPGDQGWVYLYRQDGTLDPGAGASYVSYAFDLLSGAYKATYNNADGPNPEDSSVTTPNYARHFFDRWGEDELHITTGGATGVDILDRHKALFAPGNCGRSEDTFDDAEGAFIANKVGPVRAIRSYIGANSGPNTQRDDIFYAQREDITTDLRVHAIPSVMDFFDYSPAASGMTYYNDLNTGGVTIDGVPDSPALGPITWEMVTGAQGSLVMSGLFATNISPFSYSSYYLDDTTPPVTQCTGDAFSYGSSGPYLNTPVPCTDPGLACTSNLRTTRTMYYEAPGATVAQAQALDARARTPLSVAVKPLTAGAVGGIAEPPDVATLSRTRDGGAWAWWTLAGLAAIAGAAGAVALKRRRAGR